MLIHDKVRRKNAAVLLLDIAAMEPPGSWDHHGGSPSPRLLWGIPGDDLASGQPRTQPDTAERSIVTCGDETGTCRPAVTGPQENAGFFLRDEEAAGSNPATPTQLSGGVTGKPEHPLGVSWGIPGDERRFPGLQPLLQEGGENRDR
jgi:hypothetical protein